jgi:hypothetical protein
LTARDYGSSCKCRGSGQSLTGFACWTASTTSISPDSTNIASIAKVSSIVTASRSWGHAAYATNDVPWVAAEVTLIVAKLACVTIVSSSATDCIAGNTISRPTLDFPRATALTGCKTKPMYKLSTRVLAGWSHVKGFHSNNVHDIGKRLGNNNSDLQYRFHRRRETYPPLPRSRRCASRAAGTLFTKLMRRWLRAGRVASVVVASSEKRAR